MPGYIVPRGKNTWRIFVPMGKNQETGKYERRSYTVHGTKCDAEVKLAELIRQLNLGELPEPSRITFGEFLDQ